MDGWYQRRDSASRLAALLAMGLLFSPLFKYHAPMKAKSDDAMFSVQMSELVEAAEPPTPEPAIRPPPFRHQPTPTRQSAPVVGATDQPIANETAPSVSITSTPAPLAASAIAPVMTPVNQTAKAEENYISIVRGYLNGIKRYPTGREASIQRPRGKTRIWFVIGRDGRLVDSGIEQSSDSLLLDRTALATVQRGGFPPFPETAWSGQTSHRFTVDLEFFPTS